MIDCLGDYVLVHCGFYLSFLGVDAFAEASLVKDVFSGLDEVLVTLASSYEPAVVA